MKSALRGGFVGPKMKDGLHRQIEIVWGYPALSAPVFHACASGSSIFKSSQDFDHGIGTTLPGTYPQALKKGRVCLIEQG